MDQDSNLAVAMCIKEKSHIGYDMMHNFCDGTAYRVDWTALEWFGAVLLTILGSVAILGLIFLIGFTIHVARRPL